MQARARAKKIIIKKTDDRYFFVSFKVTYDTNDSSTPIMFENIFAFPTFRWQKRIKNYVFSFAFWGILGPGSLETHYKTLFTSREQGSTLNEWGHRFHLFCTTILLAVTFLTLNNQYQKHITPKRLTSPNCDKVIRFGVICFCQYYIQSSQPKRPKESLSLFS